VHKRHGFLVRAGVGITPDHDGAFAGELQRRYATLPTTGSGDQNHLVLQTTCHPFFPLFMRSRLFDC
jgi:hypothetical protein